MREITNLELKCISGGSVDADLILLTPAPTNRDELRDAAVVAGMMIGLFGGGLFAYNAGISLFGVIGVASVGLFAVPISLKFSINVAIEVFDIINTIV